MNDSTHFPRSHRPLAARPAARLWRSLARRSLARRSLARRSLARLAIACLFLAWIAPAAVFADFDVRGRVTDVASNPAEGLRVRIFDEDEFLNDLIATVYTDANGDYSHRVTDGFGLEDPDIFVVVDWAHDLVPPSNGDYDGAKTVLLATTSIFGCGPDTGLINIFTPESSPLFEDYDSPADLVIDVQMNQPAPANLPSLWARVNEIADFYETNKGSVDWELGGDVQLKIRLGGSSPGTSFVCTTLDTMFISSQDLPIAGPGSIADIYHEFGHLVHGRLRGGQLPPTTHSGGHAVDIESDPVFALQEGWPSFPAELADDGLLNNGKYAPYRDSANQLWRGDETPATGFDTPALESGEEVEGALAGFFFGVHGDPLFNGFESTFEVFVEDLPTDVFDFTLGLLEDVGGDAARVDAVFGHLQAHGIVFSRMRLDDVEIALEAPPNAEPPAAGNAKPIGDFVFARGTVRLNVEAGLPADLGIDAAHSVPMERAKVGYKPAAPGLGDSPGAFQNFTPFIELGAGPAQIELDTTGFDAGTGDGDWDLLVVGGNAYGFEDSLSPTWVGDGHPLINQDEAYLKLFGAWFDADGSASTEKDGKLVVDNTAPTVSGFQPQ